MKLSQRVLRLGMLLTVLVPAVAANGAENPFYKGKTLTVLINYATGGPTDIEGRLAAKHLARFIPGNPTIIVSNMAGAGGVTATNFLGEVAKPDGLTMSYFTGNYFNILLADPILRVNLAKFAYIASIEGSSVAYIRKDVPPGLSTPQDVLKAQTFRAGGLSATSTKDVRFRLELDLLGAKYSYVTGYNSNSDARLALQRNEIQFFVEGLPAYRATVEPQMVKTGSVVPLYANELIGEDGELEPNSEALSIDPQKGAIRTVLGRVEGDLYFPGHATRGDDDPGDVTRNRRNSAPGLRRHGQGPGIRRRVQKGDALGTQLSHWGQR